MGRCAKKTHTRESSKLEMSLNINNAIENIIELDSAPVKDNDLEDDTVSRSNTITTCSRALKVINDLKLIANEDYIACKYLDHFQSYFWTFNIFSHVVFNARANPTQ